MSQTRNILKEFVQKAKSAHPTVADNVVEEMETLLETTLGSKEMRSTEIDTIANRLINFQIEKGSEVSENHED